jgi:hypothetical protein
MAPEPSASRRPRAPEAPRKKLPWGFAEWFVLSQTIFPALLYLPGSQPFRILIRFGAFAVTLVALVYYWQVLREREGYLIKAHPSVPWLIAAEIYLVFMLLDPTTNSLLSGLATVSMYLAVFAPVIWAYAFVKGPAQLSRLLWLFLICAGINCFFGVMQVHDPDTWLPREFSSLVIDGSLPIASVLYLGPNGDIIIRPPGLGDAPGEVCGPGVLALFLGLVFASTEKKWQMKVLAGVIAFLGAAAIFFSLVRSFFLIAMGMIAVYFVLQVARGRSARAGLFMVISIFVVALAFSRASETGGDNLVARFNTLFSDDPETLYYENRGNQVQIGFEELLPQYPMGAGLGRWGMLNLYFGDQKNAQSPPIWVEIEWPALIVDGGIFLLVVYSIAILLAIWQQLRLALYHPDDRVQQLASVILSVNAGLVVLCFSFPVFLSYLGIEFWFLTGALHGVAAKVQLQRRKTKKTGVPDPMHEAGTARLPAS